jgi:predicted AlkP superfamily phosphohydrolase/phosphomutase
LRLSISREERLSRMSSTRVFVLGLDGATFDLLDPWIEEGRLPHLRRMMERATYGRLESTIPPITPPAWTSFMTGVNPGKHGVWDFFTSKPNSFEKVLVNSSHIRSKRFWDLAEERGKKSILLYVPLTYPPQRVEGVMISGIPAPPHGEFIYPKEIERELEEKLGKWWVEPDGDKLRDFHEETFLDEIDQTLEARFRVANYLMAKEWDLFVFVIMETDWMQHFLWGEKERCLLPFYMKIDGMIGHFMELLKEEDVTLLLSDHGFGTVRKTFYMNTWLRGKGFLASRRQWVRSKEKLDIGIFHHRKDPSLVQKIKWALGKKKSEIDWNKTQAYFINTGHSYGIKINLMGREPEGIVQPEEYQEVRHRIIEELNLTVDEPEGRRVFERVFRREDIYWGPYTKEAPDIIFIPDCEYTLNDRMKDDIFKKNKEGRSFHRRDGILILQGPGIKKGKKIMGAHIMDVAPTILYLLGLPVSLGFDGKVLTEALEPDALKANPIRTEDIPLEVKVAGFEMTGTEEEEIKKKLRGLGYMG